MSSAFRIASLLGIVSAFAIAQSSGVFAQTTINQIGIVNKVKVVAPPKKPTGPVDHLFTAQCKVDLKYEPVCAVTKHRVVVTYSNTCFAQLDGATPLFSGECPPFNCSSVYAPVCARPDIDKSLPDIALKETPIQPFINSCMATIRASEYYLRTPDGKFEQKSKSAFRVLRQYPDDIYYQARFKTPPYPIETWNFVCPSPPESADPKHASCPEVIDYVCAEDQNGFPRLYKNRCFAVLAGADPNAYNDANGKSNVNRCDRLKRVAP
jgi:hypothetical protein